MSDNKTQSGGLTGFFIRTLLLIALALTVAGAYFAFVVLPREWPERTQGGDAVPAEALPAKYGNQPSVFSSSSTTVTASSFAELDLRPPSWRTLAHVEKGETDKPDIVITVTDMDDRLLPVDYFTASIVLSGDEKQILPGVGFSEEEPGRFVARGVTLPENGDWEIRATVRRGQQTMLIGQKIAPLMPFKPRGAETGSKNPD